MTQQSSPRTREQIAALRDRPSADVLIVGAGINGIATFRDLALQGVDVAIVERGDFVSGTSSASSHMVHGGVRYLENSELRLVRESVAERNRLLRNAPHYVRPLPTTIPIFKTFSGILSAPARLLITHGRGKPNERGAALIKMGLVLYDTFSRDGGQVPRHRFLRRRRALEELPDLNPDLAYTATYYDASMHDPERLALDVLHDGTVAGGERARAANYLAAVGAGSASAGSDGAAGGEGSTGSARGSVRLRDEATGDEFDFSARVILNTSGPWTDLTNEALGTPTRFMGGTKGSHIVLDNSELLRATGGREIFFEHSDGRIVLIYPLKGRVMVGTTDIFADPREQAVCTDDEIDYFFELIAHVFPAIAVDRSQIVYTFSGIRPLPAADDSAPGFVSRDYRIERGALGGTPLLSLVGGKWTTFRALAEHLAGDALELLGAPRSADTRTRTIGGGRNFPVTDDARRVWIEQRVGTHSAELVERLLDRYGTRADEFLAILPEAPTELAHTPGYLREEIAHIATTENVVHLDDVLLRRTSLAFVGGLGADSLREIAEVVAAALGWDEGRCDREIERAESLLRENHRVELDARGVAPIRLS